MATISGSGDDIFVTKFDRNGTSSWTRLPEALIMNLIVAMELDLSGKLHLAV